MSVALFLLNLNQGLFALALTVKSTDIRRIFSLPIATISLYLASSWFGTGLPFPVHYFLSCGQLTNLIIASDYLLITDVQKEFSLKGQTTLTSALSFYSRLRWALNLLNSPRGIGWTHEPSNVLPPPRQEYQRVNGIKKFTVDQLIRLALYAVLFLFASLCSQERFLGDWQDPSSMHSPALYLRPIRVLLWAIPVVVFLDAPHRLLGLILVHARSLEAKDWVPLFGSWREAYTVQRFWGRTWHQMLRRFTSSHSKFVAERVLHLKKKTHAYFLVQVFIAFLVAAMIHATADFLFTGEQRGAFNFFLAQVVAIAFEGVLATNIESSFVKAVNPLTRRSLGYLWVLAWFTFSVPLWDISFINEKGFVKNSLG